MIQIYTSIFLDKSLSTYIFKFAAENLDIFPDIHFLHMFSKKLLIKFYHLIRLQGNQRSSGNISDQLGSLIDILKTHYFSFRIELSLEIRNEVPLNHISLFANDGMLPHQLFVILEI